MTPKKLRLINWLTWLSLTFIGKKAAKNYLPVTILAGLFTVTTMLIGRDYKFWKIKGSSRTLLWNHLSLVLGPFLVANFWIFKFTFGHFKKYILTNLLNNIGYAFFIIPKLSKMNFLKYSNFTKWHHIGLTMVEAMMLYGYQSYLHNKKSDVTK